MDASEKTVAKVMYGYSTNDSPKQIIYNLVDRVPSVALRNVIDSLQHLPEDARVLNLGCGDGILESNTQDRSYSFTSIDLEPAAIATLTHNSDVQAVNSNDKAIIGNITQLDTIDELEGIFDAAVSWRVLHGINPTHYISFFQQVRSLLKPGASFYISAACDQDWKATALADNFNPTGVNDCSGVMFRDFGFDRTHLFPVHFFNQQEIVQLGTNNGFELKVVDTFEEPSGYSHLKDKRNTYLFAHFVAK